MNRMRIGLLVAVGLLLVGSVLADDRLNVVLIMADDSAADNYGCYGSTFFKTPRLDALAAEGARFTHCYSEPVCTSSRVKIMTGRDNIRNYVRFGTLHKDEITFGTMMKEAGYATAVSGKWQLHGGDDGSLAPDCGFDTYCLWNYPGATGSRFWKPEIIQDGEKLETGEKDYGPDIFSQFLIDFMEEKKDPSTSSGQAQPFFVYYPMALVHSPFVATPDSAPETAKSKDKGLEYFRDMTAYADKTVGRIVDSLEAMGLREKTVVIYTTDNGTHRNLTYPFGEEERQGEKAFATDGGTHAPLIVSCPGVVKAGTVCEDLVDFSDVMPTIAQITGAELPDVELDGRSFWPQCVGEKGSPRKWIYQYYYPKLTEAAEAHGQGVNGNEIAWAQNQSFKLYRAGSLYAVADRYEKDLIPEGQGSEAAETARKVLRKAIESMPETAVMLDAKDKDKKAKKK